MTKKKQYAARRYAELSLQFWHNRDGQANFSITSNPRVEGKNIFDGNVVDPFYFAGALIQDGKVSRDELLFLCGFFDKVRGYLDNEKPMVPIQEQDKSKESETTEKEADDFWSRVTLLGTIGNDEEGFSAEDAKRILDFIEKD